MIASPALTDRNPSVAIWHSVVDWGKCASTTILGGLFLAFFVSSNSSNRYAAAAPWLRCATINGKMQSPGISKRTKGHLCCFVLSRQIWHYDGNGKHDGKIRDIPWGKFGRTRIITMHRSTIILIVMLLRICIFQYLWVKLIFRASWEHGVLLGSYWWDNRFQSKCGIPIGQTA